MIREIYCSFKIAMLLKECGFNEEDCHMFYAGNTMILSIMEIALVPEEQVKCLAPTQQMAVKWLRDVHHIYCLIDVDQAENGAVVFYPDVYLRRKATGNLFRVAEMPRCPAKGFATYEEAMELAILYALENLIDNEQGT